MRAAGCEPLADSEELAVMGLAEVLQHLPRLLKLRRRVREAILARKPAVFVGIDAPEFNLGLAGWLKARGLRTVQYVSPQVWAWRQGRVKHIGEAVDRVLCLLPFEVDFYARNAVTARFVGHPLADQIPLEADRAGARIALGLPPDATVVALLPGSRLGEVERLGFDFARTAALLASARSPASRFIAPMANARVRAVFERQVAEARADVTLYDGRSQEVLAAADVVLVASGTATLETLLTQRPMVVAYRVAGFTAFVLRSLGLVKVRHFSQPNLLAGEGVVPEFIQEQVTPENLAGAVSAWLDDPAGSREPRRALRGHPPRAAPGWRPRRRRRHPRARRLAMKARIAGVDEAGRGPLAGPVFAAAVVLDARRPIEGLADSKQLTADARERLAAADPPPRRVLVGGLGRLRGDRQPEHPPRELPRDASRAARPAARADAGAGRRQPICRRSSICAAAARRSSAATRACPRSAPRRSSRRRRATR